MVLLVLLVLYLPGLSICVYPTNAFQHSSPPLSIINYICFASVLYSARSGQECMAAWTVVRRPAYSYEAKTTTPTMLTTGGGGNGNGGDGCAA